MYFHAFQSTGKSPLKATAKNGGLNLRYNQPNMTAKLLASCLLLVACAFGQDKPVPQRNQTEVKLTGLSRSERGDTLTAAITLTNKSPYYVFLLLVDKPHAVNDAGEVFDTSPSVNGVAWCRGFDSYPSGLTAKGACVTNRAAPSGAGLYQETSRRVRSPFVNCGNVQQCFI
jgi:hypothetical protein